ncbi:TonB-dependent receptor plug domain-containing protein [Psychrobium sp. MM17-31]|uniref:TonB-dependent receptor plug domain-containing protein n=1 Tax=Psychrobium sp. MM17-31 TaxID=2917758 RepID=UPI001EF427A7|nr:TonB-dependent receptor plug domain-containing protein [Psychrobium sp. MM17-31]MCG7530364.1 TonB-dependent receptor plug domain-containing protein [Psychrobium sp. MM17-31]
MKFLHMLPAASIVLAAVAFGEEKVATPVVEEKASEQQQKNSVSNKQCAKDDKQCLKPIERIKVVGQRINPISQSSEGSYTLDQKLIEDYNFGNGNLNDLLGVLPGVQYGESAYQSGQVSNIKPPEVSIAGSYGQQSGYSIDGINNNSKLNTSNATADRNLLQDVVGHSQEVFINLQLLDEVTVYDSNIPAKYGQFSGGLVLAKTKNAEQKTQYGFSYRQTAGSFVEYQRFYAPTFSGDDTLPIPDFSKRDFSAYYSTPLNEQSGISTQLQMLESKESFDQLGTYRQQVQKNYNAMVKYHNHLTANDLLTTSLLYAPFDADYFDTNALNSDYNTTGGGLVVTGQWEANRDWGDFDSTLSWRNSTNNKETSSQRLLWAKAEGRNWGEYTDSSVSAEGGYGDIEKIQDTIAFSQDFVLNAIRHRWGYQQFNVGYKLEHQHTQFNRLEDSVIYNGVVISPDINCNGYTVDCVETRYHRPIAELEAELGRPFDFTNAEDVLLFDQNIAQTGQYFQRRQVSPQSNAEAKVNYLSLYIEDEIDWERLTAVVGLRYEYNDFFKNHTLSPRARLKFDLTEDATQAITLGINRYYQGDVASYKLNEAMTPMREEVRKVLNNRPGQWEAAKLTSGYGYEYKDTKTPYSDEITLAYRAQLLGGTLEAKWLNRKSKDSINRVKGFNETGQSVLFGGNDGSSEYERISLSWMANFDNQHVQFNLSHAVSKVDAATFDGKTQTINFDGSRSTLNFDYDDSELVFLRTLTADGNNRDALITRNDLGLERRDFNRPIVANLGWGGEWGAWRLSAAARYNGKQDIIYATNQFESYTEATTICNGCAPSKREYPLYIAGERPAFWLLSGSIKYSFDIFGKDKVVLSFDGENLLNKRTYQIAPKTTGLELGRRFWLGISYKH